MLAIPNVVHAIIFDRKHGCLDESATDEELAEKILFYHPVTDSLDQQLTRINMLEGLIEFSNKFSLHPIDSIYMMGHTWAFYQCEPDVWIAVSLLNSPVVDSVTTIPIQKPNAVGLQHAIKKMYQLVTSFVVGSSLTTFLDRDAITIDRVKELRKRIRKLKIRALQEEQDINAMKAYDERKSSIVEDASLCELPKDTSDRVSLTSVSTSQPPRSSTARVSVVEESTRQSEQLGIRRDAATLEELNELLKKTFEEIVNYEKELNEILTPQYALTVLRQKLMSFMIWYLGCGELLSPCFLHMLNGMHYAPMARPCVPMLMQVRYSLEDVLGPFYRGCAFLYNGQIAWSDLENEGELSLLYNFIRLKEGSRWLNSAASELKQFKSIEPQVVSPSITRSLSFFDSPSKKSSDTRSRRILSFGRRAQSMPLTTSDESNDAIKEWMENVFNAKGFVTCGWSESEDMSTLTNFSPSLEPLNDDTIWSPKYSREQDCAPSEEIERVVLYRHGRFILILLLPPEAFFADNLPGLLTAVHMNLRENIPNLNKMIEDIFLESNNSLPPSTNAPSASASPAPGEKQDKSNNTSAPQVRIFYANDCVKAVKISGSKTWTPQPSAGPLMSPKGNDKPSAVSLEKVLQEPLLYSSLAQSSFLATGHLNPGFVECSPDEVSAMMAVTAAGAYKYATAASHIAASIDPDVLNALNGLNEILVMSTINPSLGNASHGSCREACTRVSAVQCGGKWVFGRVRGDRRVFVLVEGYATVNEMYAVINDIFDGVLGSIMM